jgi:dihydroorotase
MPDHVDLIVRNGTVVTPTATVAADIAIRDGRFVAIEGGRIANLVAAEEFDATGLHVLPGIIDGHVHFREPGLEHKEDWGTGSTAAVMGGVTTVIDMPNTNPTTATVEGVTLKRRLAEAKSYVDFGIMGLFVQENLPSLGALADAGVIGFKCFLAETVGSIPAPDDGMMLDGLREIAALGLRVSFHAENNEVIQHNARRLKAQGRTDALAHLESRPAIAEVEAIQRMALFARETGARIHILHVSSRDGLDAIEAWRARGVDITCETAPHFVFLGAEEMATLGARLRVNPPVRLASEGHGEVLLAGLRDGRIEMIATDHAPHTPEEKLRDNIWEAVSGFPGVETSLRLFLTLGVHAGRMTLQQLVRATSEGPARTWGLYPRKGAIRAGSDADLTIVDLAREGVLREAELHSRTNVTPYDGRPTLGAAVATIVRGRIVMREGTLLGAPAGRMIRPEASGLGAPS